MTTPARRAWIAALNAAPWIQQVARDAMAFADAHRQEDGVEQDSSRQPITGEMQVSNPEPVTNPADPQGVRECLLAEIERIEGNGSPMTDFGKGVIAACKDIRRYVEQARARLEGGSHA